MEVSGRSVLFTGTGSALLMVQGPAPMPMGREVLVRITRTALCRSDLLTHSGRRLEATPTVLGHEIVGEIAAFGPDADRHDAAGRPAELGDRVTWAINVGCGNCFFCKDELPQKCQRQYKYGHQQTDLSAPHGGGLADHLLLVSGTAWYRVPPEVPDRIAALANCSAATAAAVLRSVGPLADRTVLVFGLGVLGSIASAMARTAGATKVLAADPVPQLQRRGLEFGAHRTGPPDAPYLSTMVAEETEGRGADVVLELSGHPDAVAASLEMVRTGGIVVLAGSVSPGPPLALDPQSVVRRMLTLRGVHNYHPADLETALSFLGGPGRSYPLDSLLAEEFPLERAEEAFAVAHARPGVRVSVICTSGDPGAAA